MNEPPKWLAQARSQWANTGRARPPFAEEPGPGQESVWDYPRPPALVTDERLVVVGDPDEPLALTRNALRVLETASPPTFYLPPGDVDVERLVVVPGSSMCEWKGQARYWALPDQPDEVIAWDYPKPFPEFEQLAGYLSFYPGRIECRVDGEVVRPQPGGFYGGWITDEIVGPVKGEPGTGGW
ncbi:MAG: DUF427 domain-containing protein [Acidimicrobiia bacterium]|nr:DUF427 domain-containing protein [Acidimicrobiia bacterium]